MESTFHSWQEFVNMGGYGLYVWGAYSALILSFLLGVWYPWRQRKTLLNSLLSDELIVPADTSNSIMSGTATDESTA